MLNQALPTIPEIPDDWSGDPSRWEELVRNIGKTALTTCLTVVTTETVLNLMPGWGPNLYKDAAHACTGISIIVPAGRTNPRSTSKRGSKPIYQATQHMSEAVYGTPAETSQLPFHDSPLEAPDNLVNGPTGNREWIPLKRWQGRSLGDWYTSSPYYCEPDDRQTDNCDEYPWKATNQGGPTNRALEPQTPLPHLRIINAEHNKDSGRELGSFYARCHVDDNEWFLSIPAPLEEIPLLGDDGLLNDLPFHHLAPTLCLGSSCT